MWPVHRPIPAPTYIGLRMPTDGWNTSVTVMGTRLLDRFTAYSIPTRVLTSGIGDSGTPTSAPTLSQVLPTAFRSDVFCGKKTPAFTRTVGRNGTCALDGATVEAMWTPAKTSAGP